MVPCGPRGGQKQERRPGNARGVIAGVFILLIALMARAQGAELALPVDAGSVPARGYLEAFFDPTGALTEADVRSSTIAFSPLPGNFNASYTPRGAWWLRLKVQPQAGGAGNWWLEITAPYTDAISAYVPEVAADGALQSVRKSAGMLLPARERDLFTFTNVVQLSLPAAQASDIYLRLSGSRALNAEITLWRLPELMRHLALSVLVFSLGVGAAGITAVGALIIAAWLRSAVFAWYGAYVGSVAVVFLGNGGFGPVVLEGWDPAHILWLQNINGCFSVLAGAFMARAIFGTRQRARAADVFIHVLGALAVVGMVASAFGQYTLIAPYLMVGILILALLTPWLAVQQIRAREPAAVFYFIGFTSYSAASIWFALVVLGLAPFTGFMSWGYQTVGLLHMAAIFAGLASAMRAGARQRQNLEVQLLAASRRNARHLEQAVAERTSALHEEIEARRRAEEALRRALKEQRNFLIMVSHEFRTPLSTMRLSVSLLEESIAPDNAAPRRELDKIGRAVLRLSNLIDTFLAEEWLEQNAMLIQRRSIDLAALAGDVVRDHAAHAPERLSLHASGSVEIEGDGVLLRALIDNLVGNALKHTQGPVRVSVASHPTGALLRVTDCGEGIVETEREEIFERYYRSPGAVSRPGAGIGLHLVRLIAQRHGGQVSVHDAPEGGSVFEALLPHSPPHEALPAQERLHKTGEEAPCPSAF